ncbi:PhzF family phenazine biosynthesis protein [Janthinobacterium agaricidamnosum]|uniref:Phenazine biosynthesis PhzF family protein n=1 Tax=Janthinobacterium agaricidamnosum NBRC 102515 = DSM 9628 TaxID=1349767 RepID=W0V6F9_9BURK|nr:PhzF family phenazine biosynthesis protein [Janthinobacterium agaricidamnosum]CDG84419.1 phenazine biosynthesis PhzF family protein [Janthinobacterium agaricidamnosum NBRC 102515 = DSM 9628]
MFHVEVVNVFTSAAGGGNPAPIIIDAEGLSEDGMQMIAQSYGHESGFVFAPENAELNDHRFRFFVPRHEMSMCGHATIGAVWLLAKRGKLTSDRLSIQTLSGTVMAYMEDRPDGEKSIEISQPPGTISEIPHPELRQQIIRAMGLRPEDVLDLPFLNASTSRIKTLIPLRNPAVLDAAIPDSPAIEQLCEAIGSTGFYPFAADPGQARQFDARQFPKSSGYPEDAATGIAATALAFGLLHYGMIELNAAPVLIHQGRAMGQPSDIFVRFELAPESPSQPVGCFVGGTVALSAIAHAGASDE